jgi:hypothetical protein
MFGMHHAGADFPRRLQKPVLTIDELNLPWPVSEYLLKPGDRCDSTAAPATNVLQDWGQEQVVAVPVATTTDHPLGKSGSNQ